MSLRWRVYWWWQRIKAGWRSWRCAHEWFLPARLPDPPPEAMGWKRLSLPEKHEVAFAKEVEVEIEWTATVGRLGLEVAEMENVLPLPRFGVAGGNVVSGEATAASIWLDVAWLRARLRGPGWRPAVCRRCHAMLMVEEAKGA